MTHSLAVCACLVACLGLHGQETTDYKVYTEHPRLLLNARRIKLLKRERERQSIRWQQFDLLLSGKARMAEPGFAEALWANVTDNQAACKSAGDWAATLAKPSLASDLRQMALVYDWCEPRLSGTPKTALEARLAAAAKQPATGVSAIRSRLFAALAIADLEPKLAETVSRETAEIWWKQTMVPRLKKEFPPTETREQLTALFEVLHVVRDNFKSDLREDALKVFEQLPPFLLLTYYPQPWPAAENEYRIPVYSTNGDPSLDEAVYARASELVLVAFDGNPQPIQFLQGWLMQDRFLMKGPLGIVYEFLWANPYLPGLSYTYMPDLFHERGNLLVRASWDEDSTWFGVLNGKIQYFRDGKRMSVNPKNSNAPISIGDTRIHFWQPDMRFEAGTLPAPTAEDEKKVYDEVLFVVGAKPGGRYDVEPDGQEMFEAIADEGGILSLKFQRGYPIAVRMKEARPGVTVR